jgi:hypothetical protein
MVLRRSPPLDTSMARPGVDTYPVGSLGLLLQSARCGTLEAMASPRPTSTNIHPPTPEKDEPAPTSSLSDTPKIVLPNNLAQTLQFLSDVDLETLRGNVETELERRGTSSAGPIARKASAPQPATAAQASRGRQEERDSGTAIPAGRVSLIKAFYRAGMKPVAIARSLRVSLSVVNKVLGSEAKARR